MSKEFLWVEKYRPSIVEDCILPASTKEVFQGFVNQGELPNLLLTGTAGVGKTTVAKALCEEIGASYIVINGSDEGRFLDTVRNRVRQFATTVSLTSGASHKVVIIDEADNTTHDVQLSLRAFVEAFHSNCRFIFTCNFQNKIIEPLHSRCTVVDFRINKSQQQKLQAQFFGRLKEILDENEIEYEDKILVKLIGRYFPDWRRVLNECQRYSVSGSIDAGVLVNLGDNNVKSLMEKLKGKDFKGMRQWVVNNIDTEPQAIFRAVYDKMADHLQPQSIPQVVLILADYQYKNAFVADHEMNVVACMTEIMAGAEWK